MAAEHVFTETARAKINLTLRITGRRADGYHALESLVVFADIADALTLEAAGHASLDVTGPFAGAIGAAGDNLVLKAFQRLSALVPGLKGGSFHLDKHIPVAGGVGGGSADAAAALRLLARHNGISFDDARVMTAALQTGADVPVCLVSRACVMAGIGERLSPPLQLPELPALLVNPRVGVSTRDVFAALGKAGLPKDGRPLGDPPHEIGAFIEFVKAYGNDLTAPAIACAPVIGEVLAALEVLPGARVARMSGSGATCFALFTTETETEAAASQLAAQHPDWWMAATVLNRAP